MGKRKALITLFLVFGLTSCGIIRSREIREMDLSDSGEMVDVIVDVEKSEQSCDPEASHFAYGDGSSSNPFLICSFKQFLNMSSQPQAYFNLVQNIYVDAISLEAFSPIGSLKRPFSGTFNGKGHMIFFDLSHPLDCSNSSPFYPCRGNNFTSLFGWVNGKISNLSVTGLFIKGMEFTSSIAGHLEGMIENVSVSGQVEGLGTEDSQSTGGLVGFLGAQGKILNSSFEGTVKAEKIVGGLSGTILGQIKNSQFRGLAQAQKNRVGGITGILKEKGSIEECRVEGEISTPVERLCCWGAGGIVGSSEGSNVNMAQNPFLRKVSFEGSVTGNSDVGGIIGNCSNTSLEQVGSNPSLNHSTDLFSIQVEFWGGGLIGSSKNCNVENSYSFSSVGLLSTGQNSGIVGGLIGYFENGSKLINSFFAGKLGTVSKPTQQVSTNQNFGGVIASRDCGQVSCTVSSSFWDIGESNLFYDKNADNQDDPGYSGKGLLKSELLDLTIFKNLSKWDESVWYLQEGEYPSLQE